MLLAILAAFPQPAIAQDADVRFTSRDGSILAGTLSMPQRALPVPAVFLVQDSGGFDRDEIVGPNAVFKSIAQSLVAEGFAVLRYDKRAVGASTTATAPQFVVRQNFLDDVAAALTFLRKQPGIDAANVFGIGHGEGGELIPALALTGAPLRGIIALAPQAQPYGVTISTQLTKHPEQLEAVKRVRASAWFKSTENVEPLREFARLRLPLLIIKGAADAQNPASDVPQLKLAAQEHNKDVTIVVLDGDNHLFQHLLPGDVSDGREYFELHPVDARVATEITQWLHDHIGQ